MPAQITSASLLILSVAVFATGATADPQGYADSVPPMAAVLVPKVFQSSAMITGCAANQHADTSHRVVLGQSLTTAATSEASPFQSLAGARIELVPGPVAPVRLGLTAGAANGGLGAPPFTPLYREGRIEIDTVLRLPAQPGEQWYIDASAVVQATWGAGIGCSQVQIDVGDDGVIEATWGCMMPTQQATLVGTAVSNAGIPVRLRVSGEARSWTTSTPDHFLLNLVLDCTPAQQNDYSADYGLFDLERAVNRVGDGRAALCAADRPAGQPQFAALRA